MKYLYLVLTVIFVLFAILQYNDPDPEIWMPLYGYAAVMSFFMFLGRMTNPAWSIIGVLLFAITAIQDWPSTFKGMENAMTIMRPEIERARETSGMMICAATMLFYVIIILRNKRKKSVS
jgi:hypothetical protein